MASGTPCATRTWFLGCANSSRWQSGITNHRGRRRLDVPERAHDQHSARPVRRRAGRGTREPRGTWCPVSICHSSETGSAVMAGRERFGGQVQARTIESLPPENSKHRIRVGPVRPPRAGLNPRTDVQARAQVSTGVPGLSWSAPPPPITRASVSYPRRIEHNGFPDGVPKVPASPRLCGAVFSTPQRPCSGVSPTARTRPKWQSALRCKRRPQCLV